MSFRTLTALSAALMLAGCASTLPPDPEREIVYTPDPVVTDASYDQTWSRAKNLFYMSTPEAAKIRDGEFVTPDGAVQAGEVVGTGVGTAVGSAVAGGGTGGSLAGLGVGLAIGVIRAGSVPPTMTGRIQYWGFLPKEAASTQREAVNKFAQARLADLKAVFEEAGYEVVYGAPGTYSIYLGKEEKGCVLPADRSAIQDVSETASCRISVETKNVRVDKGVKPGPDGFGEIPRWLGLPYKKGWNIHAMPVYYAKGSSKVQPRVMVYHDFERMVDMTGKGVYFYYTTADNVPVVGENGKPRYFVETEKGKEERLSKEAAKTEAREKKRKESWLGKIGL